jgi:hypothetical protein
VPDVVSAPASRATGGVSPAASTGEAASSVVCVGCVPPDGFDEHPQSDAYAMAIAHSDG